MVQKYSKTLFSRIKNHNYIIVGALASLVLFAFLQVKQIAVIFVTFT